MVNWAQIGKRSLAAIATQRPLTQAALQEEPALNCLPTLSSWHGASPDKGFPEITLPSTGLRGSLPNRSPADRASLSSSATNQSSFIPLKQAVIFGLIKLWGFGVSFSWEWTNQGPGAETSFGINQPRCDSKSTLNFHLQLCFPTWNCTVWAGAVWLEQNGALSPGPPHLSWCTAAVPLLSCIKIGLDHYQAKLSQSPAVPWPSCVKTKQRALKSLSSPCIPNWGPLLALKW